MPEVEVWMTFSDMVSNHVHTIQYNQYFQIFFKELLTFPLHTASNLLATLTAHIWNLWMLHDVWEVAPWANGVGVIKGLQKRRKKKGMRLWAFCRVCCFPTFIHQFWQFPKTCAWGGFTSASLTCWKAKVTKLPSTPPKEQLAPPAKAMWETLRGLTNFLSARWYFLKKKT